MSNFKKYEKVIALTNPSSEFCQQRKMHEEYMVKAVCFCSGCGEQLVSIGNGTVTIIPNSGVMECDCGFKQQLMGHIWTKAKHFIRSSDVEKAISELKKETQIA